MFKNTYEMKFRYEHIDAVMAILETLGIKAKLHNVEGNLINYILVCKFRATRNEIEVLKTKLNKYGLAVA